MSKPPIQFRRYIRHTDGSIRRPETPGGFRLPLGNTPEIIRSFRSIHIPHVGAKQMRRMVLAGY